MTDTASITANLNAAQKALLAETPPGAVMKPGPTRAALLRRGLLFGQDRGLDFGKLTPVGEAVRLAVLMERRPQSRPVVREPERRVHAGDVVRIHTGTKLYRVEKVSQEPVEAAEAFLVPLAPGEGNPGAWEPLDLLHVVPPVAHLKTIPVTGALAETLAEVPVVVAGTGWLAEWGTVRQVATIRSGSRLPCAALLPWPAESRVEWAVGCLRIGDSVVVDGRLFRVVWDGGPAEPVLKAENWHGFDQL